MWHFIRMPKYLSKTSPYVSTDSAIVSQSFSAWETNYTPPAPAPLNVEVENNIIQEGEQIAHKLQSLFFDGVESIASLDLPPSVLLRKDLPPTGTLKGSWEDNLYKIDTIYKGEIITVFLAKFHLKPLPHVGNRISPTIKVFKRGKWTDDLLAWFEERRRKIAEEQAQRFTPLDED